MEASAKSGQGVEEVFTLLAENVLEHRLKYVLFSGNNTSICEYGRRSKPPGESNLDHFSIEDTDVDNESSDNKCCFN